MDLKDKLFNMKQIEDKRVKPYHNPPPCWIQWEDYLITYCVEESFAGPQPILAISRIDRGVFEAHNENIELALTISEIFPQPKQKYHRTYEGRGFTEHLIF